MDNPKGSRLAEIALTLVGARGTKYQGPEALYQTPETGFDCSGFIRYAIKLWENEYHTVVLKDEIRHCSDFLDRFGVLVHQRAIDAGDIIISQTQRILMFIVQVKRILK